MASAEAMYIKMIADCCVQALQHWKTIQSLSRAPRPSYCRKTLMRVLSRTIRRNLQVFYPTRTRPELLLQSTAELLILHTRTARIPGTGVCLSVHPLFQLRSMRLSIACCGNHHAHDNAGSQQCQHCGAHHKAQHTKFSTRGKLSLRKPADLI